MRTRLSPRWEKGEGRAAADPAQRVRVARSKATAKTVKPRVVIAQPHHMTFESMKAANPAITEKGAHQRTSRARHRASAATGSARKNPSIPGTVNAVTPHMLWSIRSLTRAV